MKYSDKAKSFKQPREAAEKKQDHYRKLKKIKNYEKYKLSDNWPEFYFPTKK